MTIKVNEAQLRACKVLFTMFGYEIQGLSCAEITKSLNINNRVTVLRDLNSLEAGGFVEQLDNKNWVISPRLGKQAIKILNNLDLATTRLEEIKSKFTGE